MSDGGKFGGDFRNEALAAALIYLPFFFKQRWTTRPLTFNSTFTNDSDLGT